MTSIPNNSNTGPDQPILSLDEQKRSDEAAYSENYQEHISSQEHPLFGPEPYVTSAWVKLEFQQEGAGPDQKTRTAWAPCNPAEVYFSSRNAESAREKLRIRLWILLHKNETLNFIPDHLINHAIQVNLEKPGSDWTASNPILDSIKWSAIPSWDWGQIMENWTVPFQGKTNSCVGWAIADGILAFYRAKAKPQKNAWRGYGGEWIQGFSGTRKSLEVSDRISARHIWMIAKARRNTSVWSLLDDRFGCSPRDAVHAVCHDRMALLEEELPFNLNSPYFHVDIKTSFQSLHEHMRNTMEPNESGVSQRMEAFEVLSSPGAEPEDLTLTTELIELLKQWILVFGPILLEFKPTIAFYQTYGKSEHQEDWVFDDAPLSERVNHTCAIIGFNSHGFIIRNSWGSNWGDNGTALLTLEFLKKCAKSIFLFEDSYTAH